jgi:hypothetical protein
LRRRAPGQRQRRQDRQGLAHRRRRRPSAHHPDDQLVGHPPDHGPRLSLETTPCTSATRRPATCWP